MNRSKINSLAASLVFLSHGILSQVAHSQTLVVSDPSTLLGPTGAGKGASGIASPLRHDSLFLNPAAAASEPLYSINANYGATGDLMSASIVDTKSGPVGGGAYFLRRDTGGINSQGVLGSYQRVEEQAGLSLLGNLMPGFSAGIVGRYQKTRVLNSGESAQVEWDGDAGFQWKVAQGLTLGGVARSILREKSGLSPKQYGLGLDYAFYPGLSISGSVTKTDVTSTDTVFDVGVPNSDEKYSYAAGAEWESTFGLVVRAGVNFLKPWNQTIASGGLAYVDKGFSLQYAFSRSVEGASYEQHLFGLGYEF